MREHPPLEPARWGPDPERPRCPKCGAKTFMVVAYRAPLSRVKGGPIVLTAPCGYHIRQRGICHQPTVLILDGPRTYYAFPPSFDDVQGLTVPDILERYGAAAVWKQKAAAHGLT